MDRGQLEKSRFRHSPRLTSGIPEPLLSCWISSWYTCQGVGEGLESQAHRIAAYTCVPIAIFRTSIESSASANRRRERFRSCRIVPLCSVPSWASGCTCSARARPVCSTSRAQDAAQVRAFCCSQTIHGYFCKDASMRIGTSGQLRNSPSGPRRGIGRVCGATRHASVSNSSAHRALR